MTDSPVRTAARNPPDDAAVLNMLEAERLSLCEWLDQLQTADWSRSSLCAGWSVADVVAHLTLSTRETAIDFVRGMLRYRGNFDRMTSQGAKLRAQQFNPNELLDQLRSSVRSPRIAFGSSIRDCLIDSVVHAQDMSRPLGHDYTTPADRTVVALDHALASRWYGAKKWLADVSLRASDSDWNWGQGAIKIVGPAIDLLLVATGRPSGLDRLTGPGVDELRERMGRVRQATQP